MYICTYINTNHAAPRGSETKYNRTRRQEVCMYKNKIGLNHFTVTTRAPNQDPETSCTRSAYACACACV